MTGLFELSQNWPSNDELDSILTLPFVLSLAFGPLRVIVSEVHVASRSND
jgi:hypothetical protein